MARTFTAAAMILLLAPSAALAQERATDAALGAVSGAVVLGPIGAVAGALIGYSAGPSISRSWGGGQVALRTTSKAGLERRDAWNQAGRQRGRGEAA
jgi:hypothetical protein